MALTNKENTEIIIDPLANINYASFYIYGLFQLYGSRNVHFDTQPFENLEDRVTCLNFIVKKVNQIKKITIDFNDFNSVKQSEYAWCDVYGHVNANFDMTPDELKSKLVSLTPSFGIRIWNRPETFLHAGSNLFKTYRKANVRNFLGKYKKCESVVETADSLYS